MNWTIFISVALTVAIVAVAILAISYRSACEDREDAKHCRDVAREERDRVQSDCYVLNDERNALAKERERLLATNRELEQRWENTSKQNEAYRDELNAIYEREWAAECKRIESEPILIGHDVEGAGFGAGVLQGSEEGEPDIYVIRDYLGNAIRAHKSLVARAKPRQKILSGHAVKGADCAAPHPKYA